MHDKYRKQLLDLARAAMLLERKAHDCIDRPSPAELELLEDRINRVLAPIAALVGAGAIHTPMREDITALVVLKDL